MPRVSINKRKYMLNDLSEFIKREMRANQINQAELGKLCGHSQQTMGNHLQPNKLTVSDLITIFTLFDVPPEKLAELLKEKK